MKRIGLSLALCLCLLPIGCVDGGEKNDGNTDAGIGVPEVSADLGVSDSTSKDSATSDANADSSEEDGTTSDAKELEISEDFGKVCGGDDECTEGPCVQTANGSVCTQGCDDACPEGWSCYPSAEDSPDEKICFPNFPTICMPCVTNSDCAIAGGAGDVRCIASGSEGSFCGGSCKTNSCPSGYLCEDVQDVDGETSKQCRKESGLCDCSLLAKVNQATTACLITNEFGVCPGQRQCTGTGLSDCDGQEASADICDGLDNDCSEDTADGSADPGINEACDGDDPDGCEDGVVSCVDGALACVDGEEEALELCDGIDNDCDPETLDGSQDPALLEACDGDDADLCAEGTASCVDGSIVCSEDGEPKVEVCDGEDNDCNPETEDGSGDEALGTSCDGDDADLCSNGTTYCADGQLACEESADSVIDICDGQDNDCDPETADGSGDASVGLFCDGEDQDNCADGMTQCVDGAVVCVDPDDELLDLCDGVDNDCDPTTADGSNDPAIGAPCDGDDDDLCNEGVAACADGVLICDEPADDDSDLCDGLDNDCNPATEDGYGEVGFGLPCDGDDLDLCEEGASTPV